MQTLMAGKFYQVRGMLHVGEVKFTPGWIFFEITYLSPWAENWKFPPRDEIDILTFLHDIYMFWFYKNTDILITDKRSVISYKLEKKKIAVLIDSI